MLRYALAFVLIVSQFSSALAQEPTLIARTRLVRLASMQSLPARCGPKNAHVYGCTQFVGEKLSGECTADNGLWSLRPKAQYLALIYIVHGDFIHHEYLHLRDMEEAVADHLVTLERQKFSSTEACDAAATSAVSEFSTRMRAFANASNAERN